MFLSDQTRPFALLRRPAPDPCGRRGKTLDDDLPDSDPGEPPVRTVLYSAFPLVLVGATVAAVPAVIHGVALIAVSLVALLFSAALSAAEVALFSLSAEQVEALERQGRRGIFAAKALLRFRDETLTTILLVDYVANLLLAVCLMVGFSHLPVPPIVWAPLGAAAAIVAIVIFGEFLPRAIGRSFNVAVTLALSRPVVGLTVVAGPLRWLVLTLSSVMLRPRSEEALEREMGSEEELKTLITASDLDGGLEEDERELISGIVEFGSKRAGEIMTPRPKLYAFSIETPPREMLWHMRLSEYRRVLIYEETLDHVRGVLHVKDALLHPNTDYRQMLRKPLLVPENKGLMDLLREFRRHRVHLAVVCDEFGRTAGVVTMHDLLEEIVVELTDEHRPAREAIRPVGPSAWRVPGATLIEDLREQTGLMLPDDAGRTVSGFVTNRLGRIPSVGDAVEENGLRLTVERMGDRRVALLWIEQAVPGPSSPKNEKEEETP